MNSLPPRRILQFAFTLIELLTVITIIAILMGLLFPAIGIVKEQARKAEAKAAIGGITAAVKQYYTEYGKYPVGSQAPPDDLIYGDASVSGAVSNEKLFDILRNNVSADNPKPDPTSAATKYNPRAIVFFEGKGASADPPRSGFVSSANLVGTQNSFLDPWGKQYCIAIDTNYDNQITSLPHKDFLTTNGPKTGVAAFSLGKDGIVGSKDTNGNYRKTSVSSDDIVSWQ